MRKLITLFLNDGKFVFRSSILVVLAIAPLLIISFLRFVLPYITANYLPVLAEYYPYLIAMFCLITAVFPAFAISFIMLDEKDENLFAVLRVMPISFTEFLTYRLSFVFLFGFLFSLITLNFNGLVTIGSLPALAMALLFAMSGPIITLITVTFASSKVEGLTILKGVNFMLVLPLLAIFIPSNWKFALSIIPQFWAYQSFVQICENGGGMLFYLIGLALHLIVLALLVVLFKKSVFRQ